MARARSCMISNIELHPPFISRRRKIHVRKANGLCFLVKCFRSSNPQQFLPRDGLSLHDEGRGTNIPSIPPATSPELAVPEEFQQQLHSTTEQAPVALLHICI